MADRGTEYDDRFAALARAGTYLHGEADLVDRLLGGPPATVLDAGCGTGRVAVELARRGYRTRGIDVDPEMLAAARAKAPDLQWELGDLATADLAGTAADLALAAGNVLLFVTPAARANAIRTLHAALRPGGLLVTGFSLAPLRPLGASLADGPGPHPFDVDTYDRCCRSTGLDLVVRLATWEGAPYAGGDYVVSVHRRAG